MKVYIAGPMTGVPEFNYQAFREADEANPCGAIRFGAYDSIYECFRPKGHTEEHATTYGVSWDDSVPDGFGSTPEGDT